jgi:hypothetical protein
MGLRPTKFDEDGVGEVGRTPWSAAGPLAGLRPEADEGVGRGPGGPPHLTDRASRGAVQGNFPFDRVVFAQDPSLPWLASDVGHSGPRLLGPGHKSIESRLDAAGRGLRHSADAEPGRHVRKQTWGLDTFGETAYTWVAGEEWM